MPPPRLTIQGDDSGTNHDVYSTPPGQAARGQITRGEVALDEGSTSGTPVKAKAKKEEESSVVAVATAPEEGSVPTNRDLEHYVTDSDMRRRSVTTKAGAAERLSKVLGLFRLLTQRTSDQFIVDLTFDIETLYTLIEFAMTVGCVDNTLAADSVQPYMSAQRVAGTRVLRSQQSVEDVLMGRWVYGPAAATRIRLLDFLHGDAKPWPKEPDRASRMRAVDALKNLQTTLALLWGPGYEEIASPMVKSLEMTPDRAQFTSTAFIVSRFEGAMHQFCFSVFVEKGISAGTSLWKRDRTLCIDMLLKLITDAADTEVWRSFELHSRFFASGGVYETVFTTPHHARARDDGNKKRKREPTDWTQRTTSSGARHTGPTRSGPAPGAAASAPATRPASAKKEPCLGRLAKLMNPQANGCQWGSECRFDHHFNLKAATLPEWRAMVEKGPAAARPALLEGLNKSLPGAFKQSV
jgi:hypothetical protein